MSAAPSPPPEICAAAMGDVPALRALGAPVWRAAHAGLLSDAGLAAGIAELWNEYSLGAAVRSGRMLVAVRDGALAGLLESDRLDGARAVIWKLYVAPAAAFFARLGFAERPAEGGDGVWRARPTGAT